MKKIITITAIFIVAIGTAHAQQRIDTSKKVNLTQLEIWNMHDFVVKAVKTAHKWRVDALQRDTLDATLGYVLQVIEDKYRVAKVDTVKKAGNK